MAGVDCLGPVPYPDWPFRSPPNPSSQASSILHTGTGQAREGWLGRGGNRQGQLMPNVSRSHAAQCSQRLEEEEEGRESKKQDSPSLICFFPPAPHAVKGLDPLVVIFIVFVLFLIQVTFMLLGEVFTVYKKD